MSLMLLSALLFIGSALLTGAIRWLAPRIHFMDVPVQRSAHSKPVPVGGGLSIVFLFIAVIIVFYATGQIPLQEFLALLAGMLIAFVGIVDDVKQLGVRWRIPSQFFASAVVLYCLGDIPAIDFGFFVFPESLLLNMLAVLALVWLLNLFNFMDGIDGIAGTELATASLVVVLIVLGSDDVLTLLALSLGFTALGFLLWNWAPAKIFMGDVGSGFIGFTLGVMAMLSMLHGSMSVWTWVLMLGVFIVDSTLTLFRRFRSGQRWYEGHASHAYQNAARHYRSHGKVTTTVLAINLCWLGPLAWLTVQYRELGLVITIIGLLPLLVLARHFGAGIEDFSLEANG